MTSTPQTQKAKRMNRKFTPEEDARLNKLVYNFGETAWEDIASFMNGRNPRQCRDRWTYYLSPSVNNSPWTEEEDQKIIKLQPEFNGKWVKMSRKFKGRTDIQLKNRWNILKKRLYQTEAKPLTEKCQESEPVPETITQAQEPQGDPISDIFEQLNSVFSCLQDDYDLFAASSWV